MILFVFLAAIALFLPAYFLYGRFLEKKFGLPLRKSTPAHEFRDGQDFAPAKKFVLFGHHFSSIAGAGPIVGPILAALMFGWLPAFLWIIAGAVFFGGVHDFAALAASLRNKGRSVAELCRQLLGPSAYRIFLIFIWLTLVYVLVVFLDLTADTFARDATVASASTIYIVLALLFGILLNRTRLKVLPGSLLFVPLIFAAVIISRFLPLQPPAWIMCDLKKTWSVILVAYMFSASILPVWLLLQPRDYLSSFLLYASVLLGAAGILFGGFRTQYPAFTNFFSANGQPLFPILFITIACGAISGFHALVSSGTSSKQLDREEDARFVGYGGMLVEGVVAIIALATVMMLPLAEAKGTPAGIFAAGLARCAGLFGLPPEAGRTFGLLVLSTFLLTTLDTATRISRYILQELFDGDIRKTRFAATAASVVLPLVFSLLVLRDPSGRIIPAYQVIWPVFGATNQLLAAVVLLIAAVWLVREGKNALFLLLPMGFMLVVTLTALVILMRQYGLSAVGVTAAVLVLLAFYLGIVSFRALVRTMKNRPAL